MTEVSVNQAITDFDRLLGKVEAGEEVVIIRDGRAVARLVPAAGASAADARAALARIRRARAAEGLRVDWAELKQDRDAGRP